MSSISSVSTIPYVPQAKMDAAEDTKIATSDAVHVTPATDARPPALAPATAAALLIEQNAAVQDSGSAIDLSGRDLRQTDLKSLSLAGANLRGANMSGLDLSGLDLSGADLSDADLSGAILTGTKLTNAKADNANFSGATLVGTNADGASFKGTNFAGAYIGKVQASESLTEEEVRLTISDATFTKANFAGATIRGVRFDQSNLEGASFAGAKIAQSNFQNSKLANASFQGVVGGIHIQKSDASNVDFTHINGTAIIGLNSSKLDGTSFEGSALQHLTIAYSDARHVNFNVQNHDLSKAIFGDANLSGVDFSGFNLSGAMIASTAGAPVPTVTWTNSLEGTNFTGANLTGAQFYRQDITSANMSGAALTGAWLTTQSSPISIDLSKAQSALAKLTTIAASNDDTSTKSTNQNGEQSRADAALSILRDIAKDTQGYYIGDDESNSLIAN